MRSKNMKYLLIALGFVLCSCVNAHKTAGLSADTVSTLCGQMDTGALAVSYQFAGTEKDLKDHWHTWQQASVSEAWLVDASGNLVVQEGYKFHELVFNRPLTNFVFSFEWSVSVGGNSGVKYNVKESTGQPIGFEYQLIDDDNHPDANLGVEGNRKTSALYDLIGPQGTTPANPAPEFNKSCIAFANGKISHWLNGSETVIADIESAEFAQRVQASKFKNVPNFLTTPPAQLFLQAHGERAVFRNLKLHELIPTAPPH